MQFSRLSPPLLATLLLASATAADAEWRVVWRDEFGYTGPPDPEKWNLAKWPPGRVNDELQAYTKRPRNVRVEDGKLVIETHFAPDARPRFSSGRVSSKGKGFSTYGRFEARIRFPKARGTWAAFWLMPEDPSVYGLNEKEGWYWPNCGEIDIVEHLGHELGVAHAAVHSKDAYFKNGGERSAETEIEDFSGGFHTYAAEWFPDHLSFFVDGVRYHRVENDGAGWESWPFDQDFYVIFNLAVGGSWGGREGIDREAWPQRMLVDYVRISEYVEPDKEPLLADGSGP